MKKIEIKNKKNFFVTLIIIIVALIIGTFSAIDYVKMRYDEVYFSFTPGTYDINTGKAATATTSNENKYYKSVQKIGDYSPTLSTYGAETKIYIIAGSTAQATYDATGSYKGCASILVLGGTHANEPSGQLTATILLENAVVTDNTVLFVINETNRSAFSYSFPQEGAVTSYTLTTRSGNTRTFKYGTRATNPVDQWPNPDIYTVTRTIPVIGEKSTQLSSTDSRNINRAYGVDTPVTYTEKVAYGITQLIKQNDIKISIDLHEASPEYQTINAIVYHNSDNTNGETSEYDHLLTQKIAVSTASNMLTDCDVKIGQNSAPTGLRGLTHIELGTFTDTLAFLCETSNASQGKLRGKFTEYLVTYEGSNYEDNDYEGDLFYERFYNTRILYANAVSLSERVARHTMTILEIINQYNLAIEGDLSSYLTTNRGNVLKACGEINVSLRLFEDNYDVENGVDDYFDIENYELAKYDLVEPMVGSAKANQAFELIYTYGVGYFLKDNK